MRAAIIPNDVIQDLNQGGHFDFDQIMQIVSCIWIVKAIQNNPLLTVEELQKTYGLEDINIIGPRE